MALSNSCLIRIKSESSDDHDLKWFVKPDDICLSEILNVIGKVLPDSYISAFEYEDEDGDRITVRNDEDVSAMMSNHNNIMADASRIGAAVPPLIIYPRVSKIVGMRNIHGLTVHTVVNGSDRKFVASPHHMGLSAKKPSESIRTILASGKVNKDDLELLSVLGTGNGGAVYRAVHRSSNTVIAVKEITLDVTPEEQRQILSELEILYKCDSPLIIGFYGAYFVESCISICTEFMDGGSLDRYGRIEEEYLGRIAVAVVRGLQYLWAMKIMHRDVKPSNILINSSGQVKLCDFGVSVRLLNSVAKSYVGTNSYMAPERLKGEDYSVHSEVWSLGVSLYEMAVGHLPYYSPKPVELMNKILLEPPPGLPEGEFSQPFAHFVMQCLQKAPFCRPAPGNLMQHPFITAYDDGRPDVLAAWVHSKQTQLGHGS